MTVTVPMSKLVIGSTDGNVGHIAVGKKMKLTAKYYSNYGKPANSKVEWKIVGCEKVAADKVSIDKNGTVSVDKDVLPGGSVTVQATALSPAVGAFHFCRCVFLFHGCILPSWFYVWIKYIFKYIVEKNRHFSHSLGVGF